MTVTQAYGRVALVLVLGACLVASSPKGPWVVPADNSRPITEYRVFGLPDLAENWSHSDHDKAMRLLKTIAPSELPRHGSPRSGVLFERLLTQQAALTDAIMHGVGLDRHVFEGDRIGLATLYERPLDGGLLFDRELIEIYGEFLRVRLREAEGWNEQDEDLDELASRLASRGLDERIEAIRDSRKRHRKDLGVILIWGLGKLLAVGEIEATREETRLALLEILEELVPRATAHLSADQLGDLAIALRALSKLADNVVIRRGLVKLSDAVAKTSR